MNWTGRLTLVAVLLFGFAVRGSADEPHRSPFALAVSPAQMACLTANHTAGTVTLVDLKQRRTLAEIDVGCGPTDVAWLDETTALVSLQNDDSVAVVQREGTTLKLLKTVAVGDEPGGLVVSTNRRRAFVALGG